MEGVGALSKDLAKSGSSLSPELPGSSQASSTSPPQQLGTLPLPACIPLPHAAHRSSEKKVMAGGHRGATGLKVTEDKKRVPVMSSAPLGKEV